MTVAALAFGTVASSHPGHGPANVRIESFAFTPDSARVEEGRPVIWHWTGEESIDRQHSVTADPGQAEGFDSDADAAPTEIQHVQGADFTHTFSTPGTFSYHCKVHPATMRGKVIVLDDPTTPGSPPANEIVPRIRAIDVAPGAVLRVDLSARAEVVGRLQRRRARRTEASPAPWRSLRTFYFGARRGLNRRELPVTGLRSGPHRVLVRAYDSAGERTDEASARFRLRRR